MKKKIKTTPFSQTAFSAAIELDKNTHLFIFPIFLRYCLTDIALKRILGSISFAVLTVYHQIAELLGNPEMEFEKISISS